MNARNAFRVQPRDSMYTPGDVPFNLPPANDDAPHEPRSLMDSWPFLAFLLTAGCAVYLARAFGWIA